MKKLINILAFFCIIICNAQSPIKPLFMKGGKNVSGTYYKDIDNDFDNFAGTWIYTNGTTSFKVVLKKMSMVYNAQRDIYIDYLVGEYQYIENGTIKVNTLSDINVEFDDIYEHQIAGYSILQSGAAPVCNDCSIGERRVSLHFSDPTRPGVQQGLTGSITIKRADEGNTQKIKIFLKQTGSHIPDEGETVYNSFNVPWGEYTLIKQ